MFFVKLWWRDDDDGDDGYDHAEDGDEDHDEDEAEDSFDGWWDEGSSWFVALSLSLNPKLAAVIVVPSYDVIRGFAEPKLGFEL